MENSNEVQNTTNVGNEVLADVMPRFSINVTIDEVVNAGKVDLINHLNKTKYELEAYQPAGAALYQGRKIAEIMECELTINTCKDDGRVADCVIRKKIVSLNGA